MGSIKVFPDNEIGLSIGHATTTFPEVEEDVFVFPATPGQQRFWNLNIKQPNNPAINIPMRFRLIGELQVAILERALREIVHRHESLRTTFAILDGNLVQIVSQSVRMDLAHDDLRALPERERVEYARSRALQEACLCFDLQRGPLFRTLLLKLSDDEHVLVVTAHPAVFDGWSIGVLTEEFGVLYDSYSRGLHSPLPELKLQYGDFTVWQEQRLRSKNLEEQKSYWMQQLSILPVLDFPTDRPRSPIRTHTSNIVSVLLPNQLTDELENVCKRAGVTAFTLTLAIFKILLQRHAGSNDIVVGSVLSGRSRVELEPSIGPFSNSVILRTDLANDPSFDEVVIRVRDTVLGAVGNQDIPFEKVVEAVQWLRDESRTSLVPINFIYTKDPVHAFHSCGVSLSAMPPLTTGTMFDLNVFVVDGRDGCTISCEFNTDLYDQATISRLLSQYQTLLEGITRDSTRRISNYSLESASASAFTGAPTVLPSAPPYQGSLEERLIAMWKYLLKVEEIHVTDDFFDLGGHSLLATQMIAEIQEEFGQKIPLAMFLEAPSIELLTALLRSGEKSRSPASDHERPTLFLVHDGDGDSLLYLNLARWLRDEVEVSCLEPLGSMRCPCLHTRIPDMAAYYIEQMQLTRPKGPYFLGGLCAGGVIAFEMATQLRAKGEEIGFVALFDAVAPRARQRAGIIAQQRRGRFLQTLRDTANLTLWQRWKRRMTVMGQKVFNLFAYEFRTRVNRFMSWVRFRIFQTALDRGRPVPEWAEGLSVRFIYEMAEQSYVPCGKYDVPVVLMRATSGEGDDEPLVKQYVDAMLGWPAYVAGKVDLIDVPGGHSSMLKEPHVAVLAEHLRAGIQRRLDVKASSVSSPSR